MSKVKIDAQELFSMFKEYRDKALDYEVYADECNLGEDSARYVRLMALSEGYNSVADRILCRLIGIIYQCSKDGDAESVCELSKMIVQYIGYSFPEYVMGLEKPKKNDL